MMRQAKTMAAESVAVRCQNLERQISEAAQAIAEGLAVSEQSAGAAALLEARSKVEFAQLQRRRLIDERVALEPDRLAEGVEIATRAREAQNQLPELIARRKALEIELREVQHAIAVAEFDDRRLYNAISRAEQPLAVLRSSRPVDQPRKQQLQRELRERLER
jgi:chaperonin cofactor prefoldin